MLTLAGLVPGRSYQWRVASYHDGLSGYSPWFHFTTSASSTSVASSGASWEFQLSQNYPDPFNPSTSIRYAIAKEQRVHLAVYDLLGRVVTTLVDETKPPGKYSVTWSADDIPSGLYFYKLTAGEFSDVKKMVRVK